MDKIRELLEFEEIDATDDQIREAAMHQNISLENLTDENVLAIVAELKHPSSSNGLVVTNGNGKATKRKPATRKPKEDRLAKTPKLDNPIGNLARQVTEEVGNYVDAFKQASDAAAEIESDKVIEIVENHPNVFLEKLGEKARDYKGNPTFFRQRGEDDASALFGISFTTEA
jgi:hypothetical protein